MPVIGSFNGFMQSSKFTGKLRLIGLAANGLNAVDEKNATLINQRTDNDFDKMNEIEIVICLEKSSEKLSVSGLILISFLNIFPIKLFDTVSLSYHSVRTPMPDVMSIQESYQSWPRFVFGGEGIPAWSFF